MKNKILGLLTIIALLFIVPLASHAQSASESYNKGLELMNKQDYAGAIASFRASMAINKSAANVKKCKAQISKAQRLQKRKGNTAPAAPAVEKKLIIANPILSFEAVPSDEQTVQIDASPDTNDWIATVVNPEVASWVELSKSMDGKGLIIKCMPTDKTIIRTADINVSYGGLQRKVKISQLGNKVQFSASTLFVKFGKKKAGQMLISISCNSDMTYPEHNNYNWTIKKAPDWCSAEGTSTDLVLKVDKIEKNDPSYKSGRTGDIVLQSQEEELIIRIDQK